MERAWFQRKPGVQIVLLYLSWVTLGKSCPSLSLHFLISKRGRMMVPPLQGGSEV